MLLYPAFFKNQLNVNTRNLQSNIIIIMHAFACFDSIFSEIIAAGYMQHTISISVCHLKQIKRCTKCIFLNAPISLPQRLEEYV